uniref:Uncharacterized protein n=1 Tax=Streptomyces griseus TaxID=1911 RepID=A0A513TZM4_STRGR|nr:hypothetical protein [Streptomyces griseus]
MVVRVREGPAPAPPGSGHAVTRSSPAAASWRSRPRPRRRARLHGPPRAFRAGPHPRAPPGRRLVVPLRRTPGRDLAGPAVAHPSSARPGQDRGKRRPITLLIRAGVHRRSSRPCTAGPLAGSASGWADCFSLGLGSDAGPRDRKPAGRPRPPSGATAARSGRWPADPWRSPSSPRPG